MAQHRRGSNLLEAFPTKEQKAVARGEKDKVSGTVLYKYWTNFDKKNPSPDFKLLKPDEFAKLESGQGWWPFTTNIEPAKFEYEWTEAQVLIFLKQMWEHYRYRRVN